jgi:C1A family cysteine protease
MSKGLFLLRISSVIISILIPPVLSAQYPTVFDLRDVNGESYITGTRSQQGGTCWTHGTMAAIESNLLFTGGWTAAGDTGEPNLAEYHLDWWNGFNEFNNDDINPPYGGLTVHEGGDYLIAAAYLTRGEGAVRDIDGQYFAFPPPRFDSSFHYYYVNDIEWLTVGDSLENIGAIKERLMTHGALGTALLAGAGLEDDNDNFYHPPELEYDPNHAVAIIGWNDTVTIGPVRFYGQDYYPPGPGGWLIKNSWGEYGWNFFYISYYSKHCGRHPEMGAVSFIGTEPMPYDHVYYYDYHGWRDTKTDCSEAFNAFKTALSPAGEVLRAVSFYTAVDSVDYVFKIFDNFDDGALSNELHSQSGTITFHGFHTVVLDDPLALPPAEDVYVYLDLSSGGQPFDRTSEVSLLLGASYRTTVPSSAAPEQSYYWTGSIWADLYNDDSTANFCIKMLTDNLIPIRIGFPDGLPGYLIPESTTTIVLSIEDVDENYAAGSGHLYYRYDGQEFIPTEVMPLGGNLYQAELPGADCEDTPEYYFVAEGDGGHTVVSPPGAPDSLYRALVGYYTPVMADDFETDLGWTVSGNASGGLWERGIPSGAGLNGEPTYDFDSSGCCFVTGNNPAEDDVDNGYTYLTSPAIELSNSYRAIINYAVWYANFAMSAEPNKDVFRTYLSNDNGYSWVVVDSVGPRTSRGWKVRSLVMNDYMLPTAHTRIRFEASDIGGESVVEAGIDGVSVVKYLCVPELQIVTGDLPDWTATVAYSKQMESHGGYYPVVWSDKNNELSGTGLAMDESGLISGIPSDSGTIHFTAVATDDSANTAEKEFEFIINAALEITTMALPPAFLRQSYSYQMNCKGGTGEIVWNDIEDDLESIGLSLSNGGLISGTPSDTGVSSVKIGVDDAVGAHDQGEFTLAVSIEFVCGDANDDETVNILDITYLINYLYKGGQAPVPLDAADVNSDGAINILDITYLINFLYKGGPEPNCP